MELNVSLINLLVCLLVCLLFTCTLGARLEDIEVFVCVTIRMVLVVDDSLLRRKRLSIKISLLESLFESLLESTRYPQN